MWLLPVLLLFLVQVQFSINEENLMRGTEGKALVVYCKYPSGLESSVKLWCRGKNWESCRTLVKTTGSEQLVRKGRMSIQDDHSQRTITMTMEELQREDADTYWCGIEKTDQTKSYQLTVIAKPVTVQCHYGPQWETFVKSWCQDADLNSCNILVETTRPQLKNIVSFNQEKHSFSMTILREYKNL
ncbi:CMRF35-like molecule 7 [Vulpes lagopus]